MKKILIAFENNHFPEGAFEWLKNLHRKEPFLLVGVFLPQNQQSGLWSYTDAIGLPLVSEPRPAVMDHTDEQIRRFEERCLLYGINYKVHAEFYDFTLKELIRESMFADLLVLGSENFYNENLSLKSGLHLHDAMHDVKCPVLLVPDGSTFPENIILAYDGSEDAIRAIRQFGLLFPELATVATHLVYADEHREKEIPYQNLIEEMAVRHFKQLTITRLLMDAHGEFDQWLKAQQSPLLVCGAFGRSGVSLLFKRSFVKEIIDGNQVPVFIAHH